MSNFINRTKDKEKRRFLRSHSSKPEIILWSKLQKRQMMGYRFLRQYGIGIFVADFYCPKLKLAIEIDGKSHEGENAKLNDMEREEGMKEHDVQFLRFTNDQVTNELNKVLLAIRNEIQMIENKPPLPKIGTSPLRELRGDKEGLKQNMKQ